MFYLLIKPIANIVMSLVKPILAIGVIMFIDTQFQLGLTNQIIEIVTTWIETQIVSDYKFW